MSISCVILDTVPYVTENTFLNLKFRIFIELDPIISFLCFLLCYGCSTTFRGPQNSRFMTLTDGGAHTVIDIKEVLQIRIWIRMFRGLLDPDPLVRGTDQDPSIIKQK
jgi:hypothetical protein